MLKEQRQELIIKALKAQEHVTIEQLVTSLGVSAETIRRDLITLERKSLLRRTHGGAVLDDSTTNEYSIEERLRSNKDEKMAMCHLAAQLVEDGESIGIVASTTTLSLGTMLAAKNNLTVVTNSLIIGSAIATNETNKVILTGGDLWFADQKLMGERAEKGFGQYVVDKVFFSGRGISEVHGVTEYNSRECELTRAAVRSADCVVFLNDHSKFDVAAFRKVIPVSNLDYLITDWRTDSRVISTYSGMGMRVLQAKRL